MTARVVFWHSDDGQRIALLTSETDKYTNLVLLMEGYGVVLRRVPNVTHTKAGRILKIRLRPAMIGGGDYPVRRARAHYRRMGRDWGITKGAEEALKEAL